MLLKFSFGAMTFCVGAALLWKQVGRALRLMEI
jgi:hypothetical protein